MGETETLEWKVHTTGLIKEIASNPQCASLVIPLRILQNTLAKVAKRATELQDTKLDKLMIRLGLYSISNPDDPEYDAKAVERILKGK